MLRLGNLLHTLSTRTHTYSKKVFHLIFDEQKGQHCDSIRSTFCLCVCTKYRANK